MPKTKISEFDVDPANNTDINSINIAEGCAPSGINNAIRQLMSDLKEFQTGAGGDPVTVGGAFAANGGATLGDASGDALTINSSAVSIPNGLNFDSNTFVIDATNNNVGIGTSSPSYKLHVVGGQTRLDVSSAGTSLVCLGTGSNFQVDHSTSGYATLINSANSGAGMIFKGSSESMRIDSSGNLLVGTTSIIARVSGVSNSGVVAYFTNTSGTGVAMYAGNNGWSSVSDERVKIISNPITDAVNKVSSLRAVLGRYKTDNEEKSRAFLIAQDVQAVLPEAVTEQPDGLLALQMTDTIPLLVAAIKEQQAIITDLKARIEVLESK